MESFLDKLKQFYHVDVQPVLHNEVIMITLAILLLIVLWALLKLRSRMRAMRIFKTQSGRVMVSRGALRDLVHSASRQVVTTNKFRVSFRAKRGKLHLTLKLKLNEGQRVNDVASRLEARIKEVLQETLSIEKIGTINVVITGFTKSKHVAPSAVPVADEPADEEDDDVLHEVAPPKADEPKPASNPVLVADEPKPFSEETADESESTSSEGEPTEEKPRERRTFSLFGSRKHSSSDSESDSHEVNGAESAESKDETTDEEPKTSGLLGQSEEPKKD